MKTIKAKTVALVIAMSASTSVYAFPGYQWEKAAQSVGIDPVMLYAVALAESASHRGLNMTRAWASSELSSRTARPRQQPYCRLQYFGRSNQVFTKRFRAWHRPLSQLERRSCTLVWAKSAFYLSQYFT